MLLISSESKSIYIAIRFTNFATVVKQLLPPMNALARLIQQEDRRSPLVATKRAKGARKPAGLKAQ